MKWKLKNGFKIFDENDQFICAIEEEEIDDLTKNILLRAPEMYSAIKACLRTSNSIGRFSRKDFVGLSNLIAKIEDL